MIITRVLLLIDEICARIYIINIIIVRLITDLRSQLITWNVMTPPSQGMSYTVGVFGPKILLLKWEHCPELFPHIFSHQPLKCNTTRNTNTWLGVTWWLSNYHDNLNPIGQYIYLRLYRAGPRCRVVWWPHQNWCSLVYNIPKANQSHRYIIHQVT